MKALTIPRDVYERIVADAVRTPDIEICGLLAGSDERCTAAYPVANVSPTPAVAYYMDPQGQINAMGAMEASGEAMLGIYHSHPRTPAEPSDRDIAGAAYKSVAYVIISLCSGAGIDVAAFNFDGTGFAEIPLAIT